MSKQKQKQKKSGGTRKHGRSKRKQAAKQSPLSRFVRNKISFETYKRLSG